MALNILLVDDSATVRAVVTKSLRLAQAPVNELFEASNGKEALGILAEQWVDLVFADINMPVMNGVEMIEKMSEDGLLKTIPVVVISTEGSTTRIEELRLLGVRGYLRKPFTPEQIREIIDQVTGGRDEGQS